MSALPPALAMMAASFFQATPVADRVATAPSETYALDIAEKRIHKSDFHAGSNLVLDPGDGGIHIQVGAGVFARSIDIVLRNVQGTVRFRADTSRLDALRPLASPSPPAIPDSAQQR